MKLFAVILPLFTFIAGAAGFFLRLRELGNVFDVNGLPQRGAAITSILIAVTAAVLFAVLVFSIYVAKKRKSFDGFENAFGTEPLSYPSIFSINGLIWLGATVKYIFDINATGNLTPGDIYFSALSALAAFSTVLFAIEVYQDPRKKTLLGLSTIPVFFLCFWLILIYRQNASNPVLLSYVYRCLAIIFAALGFYFTAGFVFGKPAPGRTVFCSLAATYFCFVTLADKLAVVNEVSDIGIKFILCAIIAVNTVYASMLIRNLQMKTGIEASFRDVAEDMYL